MTNPVLEESGPLALSAAITLYDSNNVARATRGTLGRRPDNVEDLNAPAGLSVWVPSPPANYRAKRLRITRRNGVIDEYDILKQDEEGGSQYGSTGFQTTRYQVRLRMEDVGN